MLALPSEPRRPSGAYVHRPLDEGGEGRGGGRRAPFHPACLRRRAMREQINNARPATIPSSRVECRTHTAGERTNTSSHLILPAHTPPRSSSPITRIPASPPNPKSTTNAATQPTNLTIHQLPPSLPRAHLPPSDHYAPPPPNNPICTATCEKQTQSVRDRPARPARRARAQTWKPGHPPDPQMLVFSTRG